MKNRFRKLTKAKQETIELEYHKMNPHEFDEHMSQAKTHVVESIRLPRQMVQSLRAVAESEGKRGYERMVKKWIEERLHQEVSKIDARHKQSIMALFDVWAKFTVRVLQAESDLSGALLDHPVLLGNARETIVRTILARIIPSAYEIGRGQVVDSNGKKSKEMDIVIARRDCPALLLASGDKLYPVEGVLATIEVKSILTKAELIKALDNCASIADLCPSVDSPSLNALRTKSKIKEAKRGTRDRDEYLERQRFNLRFHPATYIYGFKGYRRNCRELRNVVKQWREREAARRKKTD